MSHVSLCLCVSVCVCVLLCMHTPSRVYHGLISALADTQLGYQLCKLLAVSQEGCEVESGGPREVKVRAWLGSEAAASFHSVTSFLHMMRRPWIEASRL